MWWGDKGRREREIGQRVGEEKIVRAREWKSQEGEMYREREWKREEGEMEGEREGQGEGGREKLRGRSS